MSHEERLTTGVGDAVNALNEVLSKLPAASASPSGPEAVGLVCTLNAYSQLLSEEMTTEALQAAAQLQVIIVAQLKKGR